MQRSLACAGAPFEIRSSFNQKAHEFWSQFCSVWASSPMLRFGAQRTDTHTHAFFFFLSRASFDSSRIMVCVRIERSPSTLTSQPLFVVDMKKGPVTSAFVVSSMTTHGKKTESKGDISRKTVICSSSKGTILKFFIDFKPGHAPSATRVYHTQCSFLFFIPVAFVE